MNLGSFYDTISKFIHSIQHSTLVEQFQEMQPFFPQLQQWIPSQFCVSFQSEVCFPLSLGTGEDSSSPYWPLDYSFYRNVLPTLTLLSESHNCFRTYTLCQPFQQPLFMPWVSVLTPKLSGPSVVHLTAASTPLYPKRLQWCFCKRSFNLISTSLPLPSSQTFSVCLIWIS